MRYSWRIVTITLHFYAFDVNVLLRIDIRRKFLTQAEVSSWQGWVEESSVSLLVEVVFAMGQWVTLDNFAGLWSWVDEGAQSSGDWTWPSDSQGLWGRRSQDLTTCYWWWTSLIQDQLCHVSGPFPPEIAASSLSLEKLCKCYPQADVSLCHHTVTI